MLDTFLYRKGDLRLLNSRGEVRREKRVQRKEMRRCTAGKRRRGDSNEEGERERDEEMRGRASDSGISRKVPRGITPFLVLRTKNRSTA
ncbi:hypothetical protein X777_06005 [Ooceraea biroi]|uniref:Uncharacterized protein n=1 Tax=Ooceraea biroi TaxID=2015173 RepID=A0A026WDJ4_OOCBI|nr:hypothetical protein X777_06005 [Ooceraea biroi]